MQQSGICYTAQITEKATTLLVFGFIRQQQTVIPEDLFYVFLNFYNNATFVTLTDDEFTKFISCNHKEQYRGPTITIMGLEWRIMFYPNGEFDDEKGYVQFYLQLTHTPKHMKYAIIYYIMNCIEANYECRSCHRFYKINDATAWPPFNVEITAYKQSNTLHFGCYVDVKHIVYNKAKDDKTPDIKHYTKPIQFNIMNEFKWEIGDALLGRFKNGECGQGMYSANYGNECWVLVIAPNGDNRSNKGSFIAGPKILQLPFGVGAIGVQYTLETNYNNIHWTDYQVFHYGKKCAQWADDTFPNVALKDIKTLMFKVTNQIMNVYNDELELIEKRLWSKYGIQ